MKSKKRKRWLKNTKFNHINQSRVLKNTKIYQPKELREREREITFFMWGKTMQRMEERKTNL